jgi:hypothetical protein
LTASYDLLVTNLVSGTNVVAAEMHPNSMQAGIWDRELGIIFGVAIEAALAPEVSVSSAPSPPDPTPPRTLSK